MTGLQANYLQRGEQLDHDHQREFGEIPMRPLESITVARIDEVLNAIENWNPLLDEIPFQFDEIGLRGLGECLIENLERLPKSLERLELEFESQELADLVTNVAKAITAVEHKAKENAYRQDGTLSDIEMASIVRIPVTKHSHAQISKITLELLQIRQTLWEVRNVLSARPFVRLPLISPQPDLEDFEAPTAEEMEELEELTHEEFKLLVDYQESLDNGNDEEVSDSVWSIRRKGNDYEICFGGTRDTLKSDYKGFKYILRLLSSPNTPIKATELSPSVTESVSNRDNDLRDSREYLATINARLIEIEDELFKADSNNDASSRDMLEEEKEKLLQLVASTTGLGGSDRINENVPERRARQRVKDAIDTVIKKCRKSTELAEFGDHLDNRINSGRHFTYRSEPGEPDWKF